MAPMKTRVSDIGGHLHRDHPVGIGRRFAALPLNPGEIADVMGSAVAEPVPLKAAEPAEIQGPPPPAVPVTRGRVPEAQPPKAYIRPRPDAGRLSYGSRAALYLRDQDEYRSMIGGNKQWK